MNKLLQVLVCGLAAVSFSAVAAEEKKGTDAKTDVKADKKTKAASGGSKADTKPDAAPAPAPTPVEKDKK